MIELESYVILVTLFNVIKTAHKTIMYIKGKIKNIQIMTRDLTILIWNIEIFLFNYRKFFSARDKIWKQKKITIQIFS